MLCDCFCLPRVVSKCEVCIFSETPWTRWDCTRQTQYLILSGFSFLNPDLDYTVLDCYWEVCFFTVEENCKKKEKNLIYTLIITTEAKYRRSIMQIGDVEVVLDIDLIKPTKQCSNINNRSCFCPILLHFYATLIKTWETDSVSFAIGALKKTTTATTVNIRKDTL